MTALRYLGAGIVMLVAAYSLLPVIIIIPFSFDASGLLRFPPVGVTLDWYAQLLGDARWRQSLINSLTIASLAAFVSTALGASLALGFRDAVRVKGRSILYMVAMLPVVMPVLVVAIALAYAFASVRIGGFRLINTVPGVALGQAFIALPIVLAIISAALSRLDRSAELAASTLGARPWTVFWRITLPQIRVGVVVAAFFAFLASFNDLIVPLFVGGLRIQTLPQKIWESIRFEVDPVSAAASGLFITVAFAAVVVLGISGSRNSAYAGVRDDDPIDREKEGRS